MRILINCLSTAGAKTGIGHYTAELVRCLRGQASGPDSIGCFPAPWVRQARAAWARLRPYLERASAPQQSVALQRARRNHKTPWRQQSMAGIRSAGRALLTRNFQSTCQTGHFDLYHEPNFVPLASDLPTVVTVCDLGVLLHPEWHPADRVAHFEKRFMVGLRDCVHVIAISDSCRREIISSLAMHPNRVTRTYMGIRPHLRPLPSSLVHEAIRKLGLPQQYLLCVGTIEPRKNILTLLRAYCSLSASLRDRYPLLLVGGWGWNSTDVAEFLHSDAKHCGVRHVGYVAEEHLAALYNGARALVFPSFYEGFGLPPLEMMACGGAVICSTADALVETAGKKAHLVDPLDLDGWRNSLQRVLSDDDWWQELRMGVEEVARPYTWENCATDTMAVYRRVRDDMRQSSRLELRQAG